MKRRPILAQFEAISAVVSAAHDAPVEAALASVEWERRGLAAQAQRLTPGPKGGGSDEPPPVHFP
jgi:hypothetical protein